MRKNFNVEVKKKRVAEELGIDPSDLLTPSEADEYLGVSQTSRYKYCKNNGIKAKYGGGAFFHKEQFAKYFVGQ